MSTRMTPSTTPQQGMQPQMAQVPTPTHEEIAKRAYEKWVQKGRPEGTSLQDWLEAEAELKQEMMARARRRS